MIITKSISGCPSKETVMREGAGKYSSLEQFESTKQGSYFKYLYFSHYCFDKKVLDVGCGSGVGTKFLSLFATKAKGIDRYPEHVNLSTLYYYKEGECEFETINFDEDEIKEKYDTIVASEVIEHFNLSVKDTLLKFYSILNENGVLCLCFPEMEGKWSAGHKKIDLNTNELIKIAEELNFKLISSRMLGLKKYSPFTDNASLVILQKDSEC